MLDQIAHLACAILILWPAAHGHYWLSALLIGVVREVTQMQDKKKYLGDPWDWGRGRTTDVAFWTVGGVVLQWLT